MYSLLGKNEIEILGKLEEINLFQVCCDALLLKMYYVDMTDGNTKEDRGRDDGCDEALSLTLGLF